MRIGVFDSAWSNVGNAFFEMGLLGFLKSRFPEHEYFTLDDPMPAEAARATWLQRNAFNIAIKQDVDLFVFSGPILKRFVIKKYDYCNLIRAIKAQGKKYAILSASASEMTPSQIAEVAAFLNDNPPVCFATRDEETYHKFKAHVPFCHNGICGAFLIPFIEGVAPVKNHRPYFVSSFYKSPEPYYSISKGEAISVSSIEVKRRKPLLPLRIGYARHFERFRHDYPASLESHDIVRVHQGFNPVTTWFNYAQPNSFVSYNPLCYLAVYKGCDFVISDRVHACAAALAYGHPARLLDDNDRIGIFARMGISRDKKGIMYPLRKENYMAKVDDFGRYLAEFMGGEPGGDGHLRPGILFASPCDSGYHTTRCAGTGEIISNLG